MTTKQRTKRPLYRTYYGDTIRRLFDNFIYPALDKLLVHSDEREFHEGIKRFFHEDTRTVFFAIVLIPFEIPGKEWINGNPSRKGYGESPRKVQPNDQLIVRIDEVLNELDIEYEGAVFTSPLAAYKFVQPKIACIG